MSYRITLYHITLSHITLHPLPVPRLQLQICIGAPVSKVTSLTTVPEEADAADAAEAADGGLAEEENSDPVDNKPAADEVLLLLDGGGTKAAMEAQILEDVMTVLTMMVENPEELVGVLR